MMAGKALMWRTVLGALIIVLSLAGALHWVHLHELMLEQTNAFALRAVEQTLKQADELDRLPVTQHAALLLQRSTPTYTFTTQDSPAPGSPREWPHAEEMRAEIAKSLSSADAARSEIQFTNAADNDRWGGWRRPHELLIYVHLAHGNWLRMQTGTQGLAHVRRSFRAQSALLTLFFVATLGLAAMWWSRRSVRPLMLLASAADQLGTSAAQPVPETGSKELRGTIRAFNSMQTRITTLLEERTLMTAALSHDLRTALTRLQLRLDEIVNENERDQARRDVAWMVEVLDDTLFVVRNAEATRNANTDEANSQYSQFDLCALIRDVADHHRTPEHHIRLELPDHADFEGHRAHLRRALANLVSNGLRFGNEVSLKLHRHDGNYIIDVVDRGPGIADADKLKVFQPFYRAESSRNRESGGTGLGLTIAQNIVQQHRGFIEMLDTDGGGNTARIHLPQGDNATPDPTRG